MHLHKVWYGYGKGGYGLHKVNLKHSKKNTEPIMQL